MIGRLEVSLSALRRNARSLAKLAGTAKSAFVLKANAYGHGAAAVARAVEPFAHGFCVYSLDEALELRAAGIPTPILIMGPIAAQRLGQAYRSGCAIALWDTGSYAADVAAAACGTKPLGVHVKVDTGVARLGLAPGDAPAAIASYLRMPQLQIDGVFSHLAAAEELDSPFTLAQLDGLERVCAEAAPALRAAECSPVRHLAASAAAMLWPQTRLDMVRFGIALYGLWPSEGTRAAMEGTGLHLVPALSYRSELVAVRAIEAGTPVGYGAAYHAPRGMQVGVVPLGYADGIPRLLSNRGIFLVRGARCPIIGRVCMNMTMIDVSAVPHAKPGATVTLIGQDGEEEIPVEAWARWSETINYEIVARLPKDLPRRFV